MANGFDADFGAGEEAARALKRRMEQKLKSAEEFNKQAEADKRATRRLREQARNETAAEKKAPREATDEEATQRRIREQQNLNRLSKERLQLEARSRTEIERTAQVSRRMAAQQQLMLGPGGGGRGGGGRQPPRFFSQPPPEPPQPPRNQYLLPSGREPYRQIAQTSQPHPEYPGQAIDERATRSANAATQARLRASAANAGGISSTDRLSASIGREASIQASANREFQRYGALSSEWIGATGRGATTMQELGRQTTATIGKFGGWLAAGSLVFTALEGVRQIGHGAIQAASGVNQLERVIKHGVNPEAAESAFRQGASKFNLPVEDAANAAYEMGKVFKNQNDALEASQAVLYAVKVGELDTATASRYLIASINGFSIPANQMQLAFDEINQAQNEFGVSISDGLAGIAKAAGAWDAASRKGGPMERYHNLLAFIATAQKVTGQTGNVVGTAVQRVPGQLAQSNNQAILKRYGINPKDDIQNIFEQAFALTKEGKVSGRERLELASAIFGKQYGPRIGAPTFAKPEKYEEVARKTLPKFASGSGEQELQKQLGSVQEHIHRIGTELEVVGSNLASAGFFDAFGVGLATLNLILRDANQLLEIFNDLPGPVKQMVIYFLQARAVLGTLRKFNVGDKFAPDSLGRRVLSGPNRDARLYDEQLVSVQKATRDELASINNVTKREARTVLNNEAKNNAALANRSSLEREGHILPGGGRTSTLLAADKEVNASQAALLSSEGRYRDLQAQRLAILTELRNTELTAAALQGEMTNANARELAGKNQEVIQNTFNKGMNSAEDSARQLGYGFKTDPATGQAIPYLLPGGGGITQTDAAAEKAGAGVKKTVNSALGLTGKTGTISKVTSSLGKAKLMFTSTETAMVGLRGAMAGLSEAGAGLSAALGGPIGIGFAALLALPLLKGPIENVAEQLAGGQHEIEVAEHLNDPKNSKRARQLLKPFGKYSNQELTDFPDRAPTPAWLMTDLPDHAAEGTPAWFDATRARQLRQQFANQRRQREQGLTERELYPDQLKGRLHNLTKINPQSPQYEQAEARFKQELQYGNRQADPKAYEQVKKRFEEIVAKNINKAGKFTAFLDSYNALSDKLLEAYTKNLTAIVSGGPAYSSPRDLSRLVRATEVRGLRDLTSGKKGLEAKGVEALNELTQTLTQYGSEEFKLAQTLARTDKQREAAYGPYLQSLQRGLDVIRRTLGKAGTDTRKELKETEEKLRHLRAIGAGPQPEGYEPRKGLISPVTNEQSARYERLLKQAKDLRRAGEKISKAQRQQEKELRAAIREQRDSLTEEHIATLGEVGQIASARIGGEHPVAQAQATLTYAEKALRYARERGASQKTIRQALLAVLQAREQIESSVKQEAEQLSSATATLAIARANGDPILEAQAELEKAQADLGVAKTPADRKNALAALLDAEHKLAEDRAAIALAQIGLEAAETEDPVKKAALKVREADVKLRTAHGAAAKKEARAQRIEAVREHREAANTARIEDVEFQADMGRITTDQEIAAYTRLLRTLKLGKAARRSLMEKIHALNEETSGQVELTVGSIQLPTLYDIRRSIQGGINGDGRGGRTYTDASTTSTIIQISGGDLDAVARTVHNTVNRNTRNSRRSAGHTK